MRRNRLVKQSALLLLTVVLAAMYSCGGGGSGGGAGPAAVKAKIVACPAVPDHSVTITNLAFQPGAETIDVNDIVQWTNNDPAAHTVTSGTPGAPDGTFDSGTVAPGSSVCIQFLVAGSYQYYCKIHLSMTGSVAVL